MRTPNKTTELCAWIITSGGEISIWPFLCCYTSIRKRETIFSMNLEDAVRLLKN
ncbi:MAG: hypothetical protein LBT63_03305 [Holosporaceae bacterium]|jgi:hypothetical protein|nr:hypothetical protein [Holosporaceae bacterium]